MWNEAAIQSVTAVVHNNKNNQCLDPFGSWLNNLHYCLLLPCQFQVHFLVQGIQVMHTEGNHSFLQGPSLKFNKTFRVNISSSLVHIYQLVTKTYLYTSGNPKVS